MSDAVAAEPPSTQQDADRHLLLTAWNLGRHLNELRFRLQQNCLNIEEAGDGRISKLFSAIREGLTEFAPPKKYRSLQSTVDGYQKTWETTVGRQDLQHFVEREFAVFRNRHRSGLPLPNDDSDVEFVERLARQLSFIVTELEKTAVELISPIPLEPAQWAFELGKSADQVEHPPLIERAFDVSPTPENVQGHVGASPFVLNTKSSWPDNEWRTDVNFFVQHLEGSGGFEPPEGIRPDDTTRPEEILRELSRLVETAAQEVESGNESESSEDEPADVLLMMETGDHNTERIIEVTEPDGNTWETTPAGIEFHSGQSTIRVSSDGHETAIDSLLTFNVLKHIAMNGENYTTENELLKNWENFGGKRDGPASPNSRLTKVRNLLRPLGLTLENRTKIGWRIARTE